MTPEEKRTLETIEDNVGHLITVIKGTSFGNNGSILQRLDEIEHKLNKMSTELSETTGKQKKIYTIILYIGVGILVGGVLFGIVSVKDLIEVIKSLK